MGEQEDDIVGGSILEQTGAAGICIFQYSRSLETSVEMDVEGDNESPVIDATPPTKTETSTSSAVPHAVQAGRRASGARK